MKNLPTVLLFLSVCLNTSQAQLPGLSRQIVECSPPFKVTERHASDQARVAVGDEKKYVRFVYLVPTDKEEKPEYRLAIENAARHLQAWYRSQLGNGMSFNLREPIVEVYHTTHESIWYSTNPDTDWAGQWKYWFNVVNDAFTLTEGSFDDPNNSWIIYIDAEAVCPLLQGGGLNHVAAMGADDLKGLADEPPRPQCNGSILNYSPCRFVGGLGHELGHTLGLPHPPGCDDQQPVPCDSQSLMYLGYISYPNAHFSEQEKATLMESGFMDYVDEGNCSIDCANLSHYYFVNKSRDVPICKGSGFYAGGALQTASGVYYDTISNHPGCDSVIVTNLKVLEPIINTVDVSVCEGESYYTGGADQTMSGTYYDTLSAVTGCDSVVVTKLQVMVAISTALDVTVCEGESYYAGGADQTISGTYYDTLSAVTGCDSVIVTSLHVLDAIANTVEVSICEGDSYCAGGMEQAIAGTYYDTLSAISGCDSVVVTKLQILENITHTIDVSICQGETHFAGGMEQIVEGIYYDTLSTVDGCDSIIVTKLTVLPAHRSVVEATICEGDVYSAGGGLQTEAGTYYDTLQTVHGCDSVLVTNLTLSVCTAIDPAIERSLRIYPVPTHNILYIEGLDPHRIELVNQLGQQVRSTKLNYIDCSGLQEGYYYVRLYYGGGQTVTRKVILIH